MIPAFKMASLVAGVPEKAELAAEIENLRRQLERKGLRRKKPAKKAGQEPE